MWVRVRATAGPAISPWSEVHDPGAGETPADEVRVRVDTRTSEVALDWSDVPGAQAYLLEIDDDPRRAPSNQRVVAPRFRFNGFSRARYGIRITAEPRSLGWTRSVEFDLTARNRR